MTGLESVHDAIQHQEGWYPGSKSSSNRNPGNLRASSVPHTMDAGNYCVFPSIVDGSRALLLDLTAKITGNSIHKIGPDSNLDDLFFIYAPMADHNQPSLYALAVARYCTTVLGRPIAHDTKLREVCPELFKSLG